MNKPTSFFLIAIFLASPAWAAETAQLKPGPAMVQTLAGLAVVVGLIFALAWVSKRLSGGTLGNARFMKVLAVQPLGTREKVVLVEVGGQQMMLGVTPGRIAMLHVFDEPVVHAPLTPTSAGVDLKSGKLAARSAAEFSKKLNEFLNQGNKS